MSKLREAAASYITDAGYPTNPEEIDCVTGYSKRIDCYRFEITRRDFVAGCWLTLTEFVSECKKYGGADVVRDGPQYEIWPKYPVKEEPVPEPLPDYEWPFPKNL